MDKSTEKSVLKIFARKLYLQGEITEDQVNDKKLIKKPVS
jgi:hypothetical protein